MANRTTVSERYNERIEAFLHEWRDRDIAERWAQFRNWAVEQILWDANLSKDEIEETTRIDGGNDKGIDAWHLDKHGPFSRLVLIQSKDKQIKREDFSKMKEGFIDLFDPQRPQSANRALREKAADLATNVPNEMVVEFYVASSRIAPQGLEGRTDGSPNWEDTVSIEGTDYRASYYTRDIKQLVEGIQSVHSQPIEAHFAIAATDYFQFMSGGHTRTVTAAVEANELAALYNRERVNLFRHNPRFFLGSRRMVNQRIVKTLTSGDSENLFILNNGLTAICTTVRVNGPDNLENPNTIIAEGFQIVNGCQTTASIHSVWAGPGGTNSLRNARVPIKIIEQPPASDVARMIAESTNSQTSVIPEDWKANDKRQEALHKEFMERAPDPWFYEHKRGVWNTEYSRIPDRRRFADETYGYRHVGMKDLAQSCWAFLGCPAEAKDRAASIFNDDDVYERVFPVEVAAAQLLLPYVIYLFAEKWAKDNRPASQSPIDMLRYPMVFCTSKVLSALAGRNQLAYFSREHSVEMLRNKERWLRVIFQDNFQYLLEELINTSETKGTGARSVVRTNTWLQAPSEAIIRNIRNLVRIEQRAQERLGQDPEALINLLPFEVRA